MIATGGPATSEGSKARPLTIPIFIVPKYPTVANW
jgi:hypothetical protein